MPITQKVMFFCCLMGGHLLAMEEKPQALTVKKSGELGVLADANSSHWGFWGKTGVTVGAVGGLATLGIGGYYFWSKYWHFHAGAKSSVKKVEDLSCDDMMQMLKNYYEVYAVVRATKCALIAGYQGGFGKVTQRHVKEEDVPALLAKCLDDLEAVEQNPNFMPENLDPEAFSESLVNEMLAKFRADLRDIPWPAVDPLAKTLGQVLSISRRVENHRDDLLKSYQDALTRYLERVVTAEEVPGLLKKLLDDVAAVIAGPHYDDACERSGFGEYDRLHKLAVLKRDLPALTETVAKNNQTAASRAETKGK